MLKKPVSSDNAPSAIGPYSAGIAISGYEQICFFSGQVALPGGPSNGKLVGETVVEQTKQVMKNLEALLQANGMTFENVAKTTIFLKSMSDFKEVNEIYAKHFPENPPARATIEVAGLPLDALVEIECIAVK